MGIGFFQQVADPVSVEDADIIAVSADPNTSLSLAVELDGTVLGGGLNDEGQLENRTQTNRFAPVEADFSISMMVGLFTISGETHGYTITCSTNSTVEIHL